MSRLKRIAVIENRRGGGDPKRLMRRDVDIAQLSFLFLLSLKKGEVNPSEGFASFLTSFSLSQSKCTIPKMGHAAILLLIVGKCMMPDGPGSLDEHRTSAFRKRFPVPLPLPAQSAAVSSADWAGGAAVGHQMSVCIAGCSTRAHSQVFYEALNVGNSSI